MIVVLVKWKVKPGHEEQFFAHWQQELKVRDDRELIGEFLCAPNSRNYVTWRLPDPGDPPCEIFLNVGFWNDESAFLDQIEPYFADNEELLPFEATRRVRTVLTAESWRIGTAQLPEFNSDGVL
ncbi:MAG: hypothetical protein OXG15_10655 [Gammaproteobacteria bacterium]|nr:hypothetical protein [Gammaproteobacteria bacterium]